MQDLIMPTEIFGSVEVWSRALWHWMEVIDAGLLLGKNELAFASLFGVGRANGGFEPAAPRRGLPGDVSPAVKRWSESVASEANSNSFFGHSYVTCAELSAVNWSELQTDPFVHCYGRSEATGEWIKVGMYRPDPPHDQRPGDWWMEE